MNSKLNRTHIFSKVVLAGLMGTLCLITTGCGDDNPPVIIQQPAPVAPVPAVPPVVAVPATPVTTVIAQVPTPVPATPVTTITIQIPGQLALPPPPPPVQQIPYPVPPVVSVVPTPGTTVAAQIPQPYPQPYPPIDPNCPPWWARRPGRTVTIVKIRPGQITIVQKTRPAFDPWHRGPGGWWNPNQPQLVQQPAAGTQVAQVAQTDQPATVTQ